MSRKDTGIAPVTGASSDNASVSAAIWTGNVKWKDVTPRMINAGGVFQNDRAFVPAMPDFLTASSDLH